MGDAGAGGRGGAEQHYSSFISFLTYPKPTPTYPWNTLSWWHSQIPGKKRKYSTRRQQRSERDFEGKLLRPIIGAGGPPPGRAADRPTFRRPGPGGAAPDRRDPRARSTRRKASGSGRPPAGRLAAPPPHPRAVRAGSSWLGPDVIQTWQQLRFKARRGAPGPRARRAGGRRRRAERPKFRLSPEVLPDPRGPLPALRAPSPGPPAAHGGPLFSPGRAEPSCVPPGFRPRPGSACQGPRATGVRGRTCAGQRQAAPGSAR